jgi:MurNAc alpha-1-phosphate uridylyltransferase
MRPLTATRPKPLIQVRGRPLVDYALQNLERAGVTRAVINVHYLADQVEAHVGRLQTALDIRLSDERAELLETGGGTKKALDLIDADPFLVTNSDNILIDGPVDAIELLAQRWDPERMDALLLLVPLMKAHGYAGRGDFRMERDGSISRRTGHRIAPFVYSGTQIVKRSLFADAPEGKFSFNVIFDRLLAKGRLFGVSHVGEWYHVGTPDAVKATERLLSGE